MRVRQFALAAGVGFVLAMAVAGCGPPGGRPRVEGKVTFQGAPVGGRTLTLVSEGAPGEFSSQRLPLRPDGTFAGNVPSPGNYKVVIEESLAVQEGRKTTEKNRLSIPAKYRTAATSDRTWTIKKGDNYHDIELEE